MSSICWHDPEYPAKVHAPTREMLDNTLLIIFLKAPRPGEVKTRLAVSIGPTAAADAYRCLVDDLTKSLGQLTSVQLCFAPSDAEDAVRDWQRPGWELVPQPTGDLGTRMAHAFAQGFKNGWRQVVIIGSDCPYITPVDIQNAALNLQSHDVVIGPAHDGGYWLLGLKTNQPGLFADIDWSTDQVLSQTLHHADQLNLTVHRLRTLSDIDTLEDWERYRNG